MTLAELVRFNGVPTDVFVRLYNSKAVRIEPSVEHKRGCQLILNTGPVRDDPEAHSVLESIRSMSFLAHMELYMQTVVFGEGPKIFRPTADQLHALEHMNINVEFRDFHSPFRMIVVELPAGYDYYNQEGERANIALLYVESETGFICHDVCFNTNAIKAYWRGEPEETLESWMETEYTMTSGDYVTSLEEASIECRIRRAVLNYCLLLDEVGVKDEGPQYTNEYSQLVKWCRKQNKHTATNKRKLQAQARIYSLAKPTQLVRVVRDASELPPEQAGWKVKPHCRRGHYRMQPTKAGLKRIRIAPVFVNAHMMTAPIPGNYTS